MLAATYAQPGETQWAIDFLRKSPAAELVRIGRWHWRQRTADGWALGTDIGGWIDSEGGVLLESMLIIVSGDTEADRRRWLHISMSFPDRLPTYGEMLVGVRAILGDER